MHLLYISISTEGTPTGGELCRQANKIALTNCQLNFSEFKIHLKDNRLSKVISTLLGYKCGLTRRHIKKIIEQVRKNNIDVVFIDTSLYGKISREISKKTSAKIITFFHNCEYEIYRQSVHFKIVSIPLLHSVYLNESYSLSFSNRCVFLTERDFKDCETIYKKKCKSFFSPIALVNRYKQRKNVFFQKPSKLLFVGSYFYPNIHGLEWFINEVLPYINYILTIVGKGFEQHEFLNRLNDKSKVNIKGFVESLDVEYESSDIVVQPVFEGSGMKTKTAECFMYGKPLVSTSEGLVGYIYELENVYRCDTAESFITTLNNLQQKEIPSFCKNLRDCFERNYSLEARTSNYKKLLEEMQNE